MVRGDRRSKGRGRSEVASGDRKDAVQQEEGQRKESNTTGESDHTVAVSSPRRAKGKKDEGEGIPEKKATNSVKGESTPKREREKKDPAKKRNKTPVGSPFGPAEGEALSSSSSKPRFPATPPSLSRSTTYSSFSGVEGANQSPSGFGTSVTSAGFGMNFDMEAGKQGRWGRDNIPNGHSSPIEYGGRGGSRARGSRRGARGRGAIFSDRPEREYHEAHSGSDDLRGGRDWEPFGEVFGSGGRASRASNGLPPKHYEQNYGHDSGNSRRGSSSYSSDQPNYGRGSAENYGRGGSENYGRGGAENYGRGGRGAKRRGCFNCHQQGHRVNECPEGQRDRGNTFAVEEARMETVTPFSAEKTTSAPVAQVVAQSGGAVGGSPFGPVAEAVSSKTPSKAAFGAPPPEEKKEWKKPQSFGEAIFGSKPPSDHGTSTAFGPNASLNMSRSTDQGGYKSSRYSEGGSSSRYSDEQSQRGSRGGSFHSPRGGGHRFNSNGRGYQQRENNGYGGARDSPSSGLPPFAAAAAAFGNPRASAFGPPSNYAPPPGNAPPPRGLGPFIVPPPRINGNAGGEQTFSPNGPFGPSPNSQLPPFFPPPPTIPPPMANNRGTPRGSPRGGGRYAKSPFHSRGGRAAASQSFPPAVGGETTMSPFGAPFGGNITMDEEGTSMGRDKRQEVVLEDWPSTSPVHSTPVKTAPPTEKTSHGVPEQLPTVVISADGAAVQNKEEQQVPSEEAAIQPAAVENKLAVNREVEASASKNKDQKSAADKTATENKISDEMSVVAASAVSCEKEENKPSGRKSEMEDSVLVIPQTTTNLSMNAADNGETAASQRSSSFHSDESDNDWEAATTQCACELREPLTPSSTEMDTLEDVRDAEIEEEAESEKEVHESKKDEEQEEEQKEEKDEQKEEKMKEERIVEVEKEEDRVREAESREVVAEEVMEHEEAETQSANEVNNEEDRVREEESKVDVVEEKKEAETQSEAKKEIVRDREAESTAAVKDNEKELKAEGTQSEKDAAQRTEVDDVTQRINGSQSPAGLNAGSPDKPRSEERFLSLLRRVMKSARMRMVIEKEDELLFDRIVAHLLV